MFGATPKSTRLENAILECDFMRKWPGLSMETMRQELKQLFDLSSNSCSTISDSHTRAFEVMLVLEAKRAYDERLAGLFCGDWFNVDSPRDVMTNLTEPGRYLEPTLMWNLISRISAVSIDLLDCRQLSEAPEVYRFSSSKNSPTITWLQLGATSPLPLFYIPDDIE
ncbi:unnamed protein product [Caenorhabditis angaria]|uniref:Uncharacterized protein n=1 Tax=Caenorhabditis angaria TaxID=860376 RepID=A0A9P1IV08_9PELO|nr:unnamed protein product [Caenorhabditis angaria]